MRVKHLKNNQVDIDEEIVLKYLRYNARYIDGITSKVLKESIAELKEIGQAKYVYSTFDITTGNGTVNFDDQLIVYSNSLTKLYKNSVKSTIFAATLGFEVEKRIRYYSKTDLSKAIVFDACAGVYIESICNYIDDEIKQIARKEGYGTTYRFSPGYGDFPILYQNQILKLLNAEKHIGLLANESHILLPRKSVTAFIGWDPSLCPRKTGSGPDTCPTKEIFIMLSKLNESFLFFDGAMGTMLQESEIRAGDLPEILNISRPEAIYNIHKKYLEAGANIITSNTFGANSLKLKEVPYTSNELISAGVRLAKKSIEDFSNKSKTTDKSNMYVALDIGPIGALLSPLGSLSFEEAYDIFKEQVIAGENAGADLILFETMTDLYELKAAILAAKENSSLPIFTTMSFQENGRTFTGTDVATFVSLAEGLGVDVLGVNCSLGPKQLQPIVDDLIKYSSIPVMVQANAGLPKYNNNITYYDIGPDEYSQEIKTMAQKGVSIIGGCCGTSPEYISNLIGQLDGLKPLEIKKKNHTSASSSSKTVFIGDEVKVIGERLNPTGKKRLKGALKDNDLDYIISQAIIQEETGSDILDVNVGLPELDEKETMVNVIKELQSVVSLPLQIDSSNPEVIEAAARIYNGKPIINSVNGKEENMKEIFPIVKKYGTLVIALTLDEDGIPKTAEKRLEIASKIIETAKTYGIPEENILVDTLVLTASAEQAAVLETLKAIPLIKEKYNVNIVLGTSNVSFGLPNRSLLNTTYLAMALGYGLDAPITDSTNKALMDVIRSYKVLANQDKDSQDYINSYSDTSGKDLQTGSASTDISSSNLQEVIIKGLKEDAKALSIKLLDKYDVFQIVNKFIIPALDIVGEKYEKQEIFLPQLIRSAETSKIVVEVIKEKAAKEGKDIDQANKIVLATVQGDIHDIGKNIVKLILENYGYKVIDLGKDVAIDKVVETALAEEVKLVGLSALMTTTVANMELTIKALRKAAPNIKVMVGGAVLTADYAKKIDADYYSKDARGAVDIAREVFGN